MLTEHKTELKQVIENQYHTLTEKMSELDAAKKICQQMMAKEELEYDNLEMESFVPEVQEYWKLNKEVFRMDSEKFLHVWGNWLVWAGIMLFCVIAALLAYPWLPERIPIQWNRGGVSGEAAKGMIFLYPAACVLLRACFQPYITGWLYRKFLCEEAVGSYITNYLCFTVFSIQIFTLLYLKGWMTHISSVVIFDFVVLVLILLIGWKKIDAYKYRNNMNLHEKRK